MLKIGVKRMFCKIVCFGLAVLLFCGYHGKLVGDLFDYNKLDANEREIVVAVIDTGIDISHESLKFNIWTNKNEKANGIDDDMNGFLDDVNGWNFCENNFRVDDYTYQIKENSHGTACAGVVLQQYHQSCAGKIENLKILPLKVLDGANDNMGKLENVKKAICYAEEMGAQICNLSFGAEEYDEELYQIIADSEMLFVVSAGNENPKGKNISRKKIYPAAYECDNILVVTGLNQKNELCAQSNYSKKIVDIATLGENVYAPTANNDYAFVSGTSFATPRVTGAAAALYYEHWGMRPQEVIEILLEEATVAPELAGKIRNGKILTGG